MLTLRPSMPRGNATKIRFVVRLLVALVAAVSSWAFLLNRFVIQWPEGSPKVGVMVLLGPALAAVAFFWARAEQAGWVRRVPFFILGLFGVGEIQRALLRRAYGVDAEETKVAELWHPDTTTDLGTSRYTIDVRGMGGARIRIVQVSDLHITRALPEAYFQRVKDEVAALRPDVLVLTGDYLCRADRLGLLANWLKRRFPRCAWERSRPSVTTITGSIRMAYAPR